ncbi:hypothetical protein BDK51DRAFT_52367 [Blyttiomyces helicus]|uniref:Uncharacterized protein n=1 Tax=Blyttiomyces helicus TaxID=388810 RepID=A0A4P9WI04_9FUNG|nr:hypothetical protein BDK51DRAFT_52367 [Blyttiomyces helicus]|eukprot:RKO91605.1 hypothetical protein BDK51DRAFT_52367 [Blyttiomyces helicus]
MSGISQQPSSGRSSSPLYRDPKPSSSLNPRTTDGIFIFLTPESNSQLIRRRGRDQGVGSMATETTPSRRKPLTFFLRASRNAARPMPHRRVVELRDECMTGAVLMQPDRIARFIPRASGQRVRFTSPLHHVEVPALRPAKFAGVHAWVRDGAQHFAGLLGASSPAETRPERLRGRRETATSGRRTRPTAGGYSREPGSAGNVGGESTGGGGRHGCIATWFCGVWRNMSTLGGEAHAEGRLHRDEVAVATRADPGVSRGPVLPSRSDSRRPAGADQRHSRKERSAHLPRPAQRFREGAVLSHPAHPADPRSRPNLQSSSTSATHGRRPLAPLATTRAARWSTPSPRYRASTRSNTGSPSEGPPRAPAARAAVARFQIPHVRVRVGHYDRPHRLGMTQARQMEGAVRGLRRARGSLRGERGGGGSSATAEDGAGREDGDAEIVRRGSLTGVGGHAMRLRRCRGSRGHEHPEQPPSPPPFFHPPAHALARLDDLTWQRRRYSPPALARIPPYPRHSTPMPRRRLGSGISAQEGAQGVGFAVTRAGREDGAASNSLSPQI